MTVRTSELEQERLSILGFGVESEDVLLSFLWESSSEWIDFKIRFLKDAACDITTPVPIRRFLDSR